MGNFFSFSSSITSGNIQTGNPFFLFLYLLENADRQWGIAWAKDQCWRFLHASPKIPDCSLPKKLNRDKWNKKISEAVGRGGDRYRSYERSWDFISCKMHRRPCQEFPAQSLLCHSGQEKANEAQGFGSHSVVAQLQTISDILGISQPFIPVSKWLLHSSCWQIQSTRLCCCLYLLFSTMA